MAKTSSPREYPENEMRALPPYVPWDLALYSILKMHGLGAEVDGSVWMVRAR